MIETIFVWLLVIFAIIVVILAVGQGAKRQQM